MVPTLPTPSPAHAVLVQLPVWVCMCNCRCIAAGGAQLETRAGAQLMGLTVSCVLIDKHDNAHMCFQPPVSDEQCVWKGLWVRFITWAEPSSVGALIRTARKLPY